MTTIVTTILSKKTSFICILVLLFSSQINAQILNTQVVADLKIKTIQDDLIITGIAQNKTEITQSISYKLSVIKSSNGNNSTTNQSGRGVIDAFQQINLATTKINQNTQDRIIILLLIYNSTETLIGTSRYVINDTKEEVNIKEEFSTILASQQDVNTASKSYDKIELKGIVVDETKTKAGRDFYQLYYSQYLAKNINSENIITILETITLGTSTKISIQVLNQTIFNFFVQTQYDFLKSMSDNAIAVTSQYLENQKRNQKRTITF